jgi:hypothetical protein
MRYQDPLMVRKRAADGRDLSLILAALTAPFTEACRTGGLPVACDLGRDHLPRGVRARPPERFRWRRRASGLCAVFATPVVFYGAELWSTRPVALTTVAATLVVSPDGERP